MLTRAGQDGDAVLGVGGDEPPRPADLEVRVPAPAEGLPVAMERHKQDPLLIALQADALEAVLVVI